MDTGSRTVRSRKQGGNNIAVDTPRRVPAGSHFAHCTAAGSPRKEHMATEPVGRCPEVPGSYYSEPVVVPVPVAPAADRADKPDESMVPPLDAPQDCRLHALDRLVPGMDRPFADELRAGAVYHHHQVHRYPERQGLFLAKQTAIGMTDFLLHQSPALYIQNPQFQAFSLVVLFMI